MRRCAHTLYKDIRKIPLSASRDLCRENRKTCKRKTWGLWAGGTELYTRTQKLHFLFDVWGPFLESPETFRAHFGWHNALCIFKMKGSQGTKLCSYLNFYSLYNIRKDQLYRISESEFYEWLFGPEKLSGLSRSGPLGPLWGDSQHLLLNVKVHFIG